MYKQIHLLCYFFAGHPFLCRDPSNSSAICNLLRMESLMAQNTFTNKSKETRQGNILLEFSNDDISHFAIYYGPDGLQTLAFKVSIDVALVLLIPRIWTN